MTTTARDAAIQAVKDHPSTTFMAPYESLADAVLTAAAPLIRAEVLREAAVAEYRHCGASVHVTTETGFNCSRRIGHNGKCALRPDEDDTQTGQKYPCGLGVYCDACGTEFRGDFIVTDTMTKPERLDAVRNHVRTTQGWQCDAAGDFCPECEPSAPTAEQAIRAATAPVEDARNPADELRQAADDLAALLAVAHGSTWRVARERNTHPEGDGALQTIGIEPAEKCCEYDCEVIVQGEISDEDASYIAAMSPSVGSHLVELLRTEAAVSADIQEQSPELTLDQLASMSHGPLAIARAINSRPQ
ncbi:hypothetical protein [Streptomyces sp. NPDC058280]|uniref:hypothetical protein n=1 Tax=Streptomyces sp. NPDC058280 TaxID=3346419 RepID=UPI0036ECE43A